MPIKSALILVKDCRSEGTAPLFLGSLHQMEASDQFCFIPAQSDSVEVVKDEKVTKKDGNLQN
jgi:hypothetical protein